MILTREMVLTRELFEELKKVDIRTVDRSTLKNAKNVVINMDLPPLERYIDYLYQIGNPDCYTYDEVVVKETFATDTDDTLTDKLKHYIATM